MTAPSSPVQSETDLAAWAVPHMSQSKIWKPIDNLIAILDLGFQMVNMDEACTMTAIPPLEIKPVRGARQSVVLDARLSGGPVKLISIHQNYLLHRDDR